jgi:hypothetical protein
VSHLGLESWYRRWAKANPEVAARHVSEGRSRNGVRHRRGHSRTVRG